MCPASRRFRPALSASLILLALAGSACREPPRPDATGHPDVLIVSIDTLRADHLSAYGYHRRTSPHLDAFAAEATLFENAHAHWPSTLQSHMSIFTSLLPQVHGVNRDKGLGESVPLLAELFRQSGYRTTGFYSLSWLDPGFGFGRGFDRYRFKKNGEAVREAALEAMRPSADSVRHPFFVFFHVRDVHCGPGLEERGNDLYVAPPEYRDAFLPHPEVEVRHLPMDIWKGRVKLTERELANVIAQYDGGILHADAILHETFEAMKAMGVFDDTLIVVTSDHGESIGDRGVFGHGGVWQEGIRIPLIVKLPANHPESGRWRGARVDGPVRLVDVAPTVLRIAGLAVPDTYQGRDLFEPFERNVIAQDNRSSVLIRGRYKLRRMHSGETLLYDLARDPGETAPIQDRLPELAAAMTQSLETHLQENLRLSRILSGEHVRVELDEEQVRRLKSLGYLD